MRHLGRVRARCRHPHARRALLTEICARVAKVRARARVSCVWVRVCVARVCHVCAAERDAARPA